jgi:hypothetical protein
MYDHSEFHFLEPGRSKQLQNITNKQFFLVLFWNAVCIGDVPGGIPSWLCGGIGWDRAPARQL